jgi:hypothetical protein
MTVVPRGSESIEVQAARTSPRDAKPVVSDGESRAKNATANAVAAGRAMLRSRLAGRLAELADKTSNQTKQVTHEIARAAEYGRGNVLPEIERTGAKLKEHARPERLKQDYRELLLRLHARVLDPPKEQLFFRPTKDPVALSGLTIKGPNREHGHDYRPTPCQVLEWVLTGIDYDFSKLTFIDYGAGKGRAMLLASEHPFAAVAGVEFAEELHDNAQMNIAQYPRSRMMCRTVECVLEDACQVGPPEGESVHYFFNPFSRDVFNEVLNNIVLSYRHKPRRMYLILVDPIAEDIIEHSGVFTRAELPIHERLKVRLLSPYDVAVYRTLA